MRLTDPDDKEPPLRNDIAEVRETTERLDARLRAVSETAIVNQWAILVVIALLVALIVGQWLDWL